MGRIKWSLGRASALAMVLLLGSAGVPAFSTGRAPAVRPVPDAPTPEHLGAAALPETWQRWWRSHLRPRTQHQTIRLNGRAVELITEALPPGWQYPCSEADLESQLRSLPADWTARLRSVRFTFHPEWEAYARTDRSRIEISYIVDTALRAPGQVQGEKPEELQFGAGLQVCDGARRCVWPDPETLRTYILRHILIHELGHHVAPPGLSRDAEEEWAEAFAFRYFTPPAAQAVAERRNGPD